MDGAGDKTYGLPTMILCYIEGKIELVRNLDGDEVISTRKVYVKTDSVSKFWPYRDPSSAVPKAADILTIDGLDYPVLALQPYYRNGIVDLLVVYV